MIGDAAVSTRTAPARSKNRLPEESDHKRILRSLELRLVRFVDCMKLRLFSQTGFQRTKTGWNNFESRKVHEDVAWICFPIYSLIPALPFFGYLSRWKINDMPKPNES